MTLPCASWQISQLFSCPSFICRILQSPWQSAFFLEVFPGILGPWETIASPWFLCDCIANHSSNSLPSSGSLCWTGLKVLMVFSNVSWRYSTYTVFFQLAFFLDASRSRTAGSDISWHCGPLQQPAVYTFVIQLTICFTVSGILWLFSHSLTCYSLLQAQQLLQEGS